MRSSTRYSKTVAREVRRGGKKRQWDRKVLLGGNLVLPSSYLKKDSRRREVRGRADIRETIKGYRLRGRDEEVRVPILHGKLGRTVENMRKNFRGREEGSRRDRLRS